MVRQRFIRQIHPVEDSRGRSPPDQPEARLQGFAILGTEHRFGFYPAIELLSFASLMERCIGDPALHQGLLGQMEELKTATSCLASHASVYLNVFEAHSYFCSESGCDALMAPTLSD